jgi:hypothetical protein
MKTPEELAAEAAAKAAADAAAAGSAGAGDPSDDGDDDAAEKTPGYWKAEAKKAAAKLTELKAKAKAGDAAAAELQAIKDKDLTESQRLAKENEGLKTKAARADALEAQVQAIFDDATADLTDAQKAVIVGDTPEAKLAHFRALAAAGLLGEKVAGVSPGAEFPGKGAAGTIKRSALAALSGDELTAAQTDIRSKKLRVVAG